MPLAPDITAYNAAHSAADRKICSALARHIDAHFSKLGDTAGAVERKIWHRHPVWFLDGNPIVGYHPIKSPVPSIRLLFWSGQSFDEPLLLPSPPNTRFKSAAAHFTTAHDISARDLARWLKKSVQIQWDYKNIVKRKGKLIRLK